MKKLNSLLIYGFIFLSLSNIWLMYLTGEKKLSFLTLNAFLGNEEHLANQLLQKIEKAQLLMMLVYPFYLAIKLLLISCILDLGFAISNRNISFRKLILATLTAEFVYLLPHLYALIFGYNELANPYLPYSAFSLSLIFPLEGFPFYLRYLWYSFNLFECLYFFILSYVFHKSAVCNFRDSLLKVVQSYGTCYLLWLISIALLLQPLSS